MEKVKSTSRGHPTLVVLILLLALVLIGSLAGVAGATNPVTSPPASSSDREYWTGHGSGYLTTDPGSYHWVLTAGGQFEFTGGTLHIQYKGGGEETATGYFPGGSIKGALHFNTPSGIVESAYCDWGGLGTPGNMNLNISHFTPATTTTVSGETTVPTSESTTTTEGTTTTSEGTTTTSEGTTTTTEGTTTTSEGTTTTTEGTTTTSEGTTTTTEGTTTTSEGTTTTTEGTTTTSEGTTTTTEGTTTTSEGTTTTSAVGGVTTVPQTSTTTPPATGSETTTPQASQVQTGGGGTASAGDGLWALLALAASLGVGLTASTVRSRQRRN